MSENNSAAVGASKDMSPDQPYEMRITYGGKIRSFVSFALKFLQENPQRPLILHTLPSTKTQPQPKDSLISHPPDLAANPEAGNSNETPLAEEPPKKKRKLPATVATIPKLITVVEIIKREYGKWALARQGPNGAPAEDSLRMGLHQYNELSTLEDMGLVAPQDYEPDDAEQLQQALEGKNFLKQKFTPHLKVTLSVKARPELEAAGATHQAPVSIKKSKAARARERKRQKKKEAGEGIEVE